MPLLSRTLIRCSCHFLPANSTKYLPRWCVVAMGIVLSLPVYGQNITQVDFQSQTLQAPFKLTHKVMPLELLPHPGKELLIIGVDELQRRWLALYGRSGDNLQHEYMLLGTAALPPGFYRFDSHSPADGSVGQFFLLSHEGLYRLQPKALLKGKLDNPFALLHKLDSLSVKSRVPYLTRGELVFALDANPAPEIIVQDVQGTTVLRNLGDEKAMAVQRLPLQPDMLLYANGARYLRARIYAVDANFDGRLDLLRIGEGDMAVWQQQPDGRFDEMPQYLPVSQPLDGMPWWFHRDAWGEEPDQSNMVHRFVEQVADVNADGISDLVVRYAKSAGVLDRVNDYEIYYGRRQQGRLAFARQADTVIREAGTLTGFELLDIDGDGRREVLVSGFDIGVSQVISALLSGSIDEDVYLFRLEGNDKFPRRPNFSTEVEMRFSISTGRAGEPVTLLADINGDGYQELLISADEQRLAIFPGRGNTALFSQRSREIKLPLPQQGKRVIAADLNGDGRDDLLMSYGREASAAQQRTLVVLTAVPVS